MPRPQPQGPVEPEYIVELPDRPRIPGGKGPDRGHTPRFAGVLVSVVAFSLVPAQVFAPGGLGLRQDLTAGLQREVALQAVSAPVLGDAGAYGADAPPVSVGSGPERRSSGQSDDRSYGPHGAAPASPPVRPEVPGAAPHAPAAPPIIAPAATPAGSASASLEPLTPALIELLLRRGDALLTQHDIISARRLYERAAHAGSSEAAMRAGQTYDPLIVAALGGAALADPERAAAWYRQGAALAAATGGIESSGSASSTTMAGRDPSSPPEATGQIPVLMLVTLLRRGDEMLAQGDITAARRLYGRVASAGLAQGATGLGRTYDPATFVRLGAGRHMSDQAMATEWYRQGAALGDPEAARRLEELSNGEHEPSTSRSRRRR